ncbi:hypothetical protein ADL12_11405 [Streptomyces regalis]|uniref:Uncharacterized protein n=1 Tax=Streptomyces regalis TaxID=68262 RepID=A0A0X3V954_9ACTN|nr:hypothetical protein ADL12_11405 [Streptomyces regalis]
MDDRVERIRVVQFGGDVPYGLTLREVTHHEVCPTLDQRVEGRRALPVAGVHHHVVSRGQQRIGRGTSEAVRGTGHQDPTHDRTTLVPCMTAPRMRGSFRQWRNSISAGIR